MLADADTITFYHAAFNIYILVSNMLMVKKQNQNDIDCRKTAFRARGQGTLIKLRCKQNKADCIIELKKNRPTIYEEPASLPSC